MLRTGPKTIAAGFLHDVVEDCNVSKQEVSELFGEEVATLVESVTKISNLKFQDEKEYLASNHRKIFIAMAKDVRVILVKLADRLHNMRTLQYMPSAKQQKIANETLEVYAPIAHRLGISDIKNELEDLSFQYLKKEKYYEIAKLVEKRKAERDEQVQRCLLYTSMRHIYKSTWPVNLVLTISMYRHSLKMAKSRIFVSMALLVRFQLPLLLS